MSDTSGPQASRANNWMRVGGIYLLMVCIGGIGVGGYFDSQTPDLPGEESTLLGVLWMSSFVGFPLVGSMIIWKLPRNKIGWLLAGIGAAVGVLGVSSEYADYGLGYRGDDVPGAAVAAWTSAWIAQVTVVLILLVLIYFPRGEPRNRLWRSVARVTMFAGMALAVMYAIRPGPLDSAREVANPLGIAGIRWFLDPVIAGIAQALALVFLAAIVDKVVMFRKATGDERQQIKWFALAALAFPILFAITITFEIVFGRNRIGEVDPVVIAFMLGFNGIAAGIGVAVFKYRLYEAGTIINRTLVYGSLTAILAGAYVGLVFGFQAVLAPVAAESDLAIAASTLAVATLFRPIRSKVQAFIDQRFYRRRFDAQRTLEEFSDRLRDEVDLGSLSSQLSDVVRETMQPAHVSLWLRDTR